MVRSYHKLLTLQPKYLTAEELLNKSGPNPRIKYCVFSENGVSKHSVDIGIPLRIFLCPFEHPGK